LDDYFDLESQMRVKSWSRPCVTLISGACDCASLLSGRGSTLAITGSYILAMELSNNRGIHKVAFAEYKKIQTFNRRQAKKGPDSFPVALD